MEVLTAPVKAPFNSGHTPYHYYCCCVVDISGNKTESVREEETHKCIKLLIFFKKQMCQEEGEI
jgi:hypothetical protein